MVLMISVQVPAQKYVTKNGYIRFYSQSAIENIEAMNRQVNAALNTNTGDFVFKVLMRSFTFQKAMMQEHFNENYVESDKYPDGTFIGKISNIREINFSKDGIYPATVEGNLTLHGVTKPVKETGTLEVKNAMVTGKSKFNILLSDYRISIPNTLVNNISKTIEITVEVTMNKITN
jgi:polyisoprenoid-binding protein YceI